MPNISINNEIEFVMSSSKEEIQNFTLDFKPDFIMSYCTLVEERQAPILNLSLSEQSMFEGLLNDGALVEDLDFSSNSNDGGNVNVKDSLYVFKSIDQTNKVDPKLMKKFTNLFVYYYRISKKDLLIIFLFSIYNICNFPVKDDNLFRN